MAQYSPPLSGGPRRDLTQCVRRRCLNVREERPGEQGCGPHNECTTPGGAVSTVARQEGIDLWQDRPAVAQGDDGDQEVRGIRAVNSGQDIQDLCHLDGAVVRAGGAADGFAATLQAFPEQEPWQDAVRGVSFTAPRSAAPAAAPAAVSIHVRAAITWLAIFPLVAVGMMAAAPLMENWHPVFRAMALTLVVVPTAVYVVLPRLFAVHGRLARRRSTSAGS